MVLFKEIKKTSASDNRNTLYSKINEKIAIFEKEREVDLPKLKKQYKSIINKIKVKEKEKQRPAEFWEEYWPMIDIKDSIYKDIDRIENSNEEIEYMLDIIPYIIEYTQEEEKSHNDDVSDVGCDTDIINPFTKYDNNISNFVNITGNVNKGDVYNRYMSEIEGEYTVRDTRIKHKSKDICPYCKGKEELFEEESTLTCMKCGYSIDFIDSTLKFASYQQDFEVVSYIAYKRINHFNEWLSQFQGTESTVVPQEVFDKLILEFKKIRMSRTDDIKSEKIREFLKKLKLNKYYEHIPYILRILQGKKPPSLTTEMENELRKMFKDIQEPFSKACPKNRKNFLSYSYVIHKFCELLEYDEFLESFSLLKSREKLYQQDVIWKAICKELKWEFIPSL